MQPRDGRRASKTGKYICAENKVVLKDKTRHLVGVWLRPDPEVRPGDLLQGHRRLASDKDSQRETQEWIYRNCWGLIINSSRILQRNVKTRSITVCRPAQLLFGNVKRTSEVKRKKAWEGETERAKEARGHMVPGIKRARGLGCRF